ncbi:hypothetical protein [uncultured Alistipes sp.]|uniref:hypothetical protein n=1 Tax=uncultured Alistipes sp. TaxID=538949 RepID=UPI0032B199BD
MKNQDESAILPNEIAGLRARSGLCVGCEGLSSSRGIVSVGRDFSGAGLGSGKPVGFFGGGLRQKCEKLLHATDFFVPLWSENRE